jgi:hypothetical protein
MKFNQILSFLCSFKQVYVLAIWCFFRGFWCIDNNILLAAVFGVVLHLEIDVVVGDGLVFLWFSVFVKRVDPVVVVVPLVVLHKEQFSQGLSQEPVIWLVLELQGMDVVQEGGDLYGKAFAKNLHRHAHLLLHYPVVFLRFVVRLDSHPR